MLCHSTLYIIQHAFAILLAAHNGMVQDMCVLAPHTCRGLQDNLLHGRFLAEVTQEVFADLEDTKYQHTEYRISIYGRKTVEWDILAAWVCQNKLYSDKNVWLIQVRLPGGIVFGGVPSRILKARIFQQCVMPYMWGQVPVANVWYFSDSLLPFAALGFSPAECVCVFDPASPPS